MITQILCIFIIICILCLNTSSNTQRISLLFFWILCPVIIFFTAFRDGTKVTDYDSYQLLFDMGGGDFGELTFVLLIHLIKTVLHGDIVTLMLIYALFTIPLKFFSILRYSEFIFFSLLIWIGNLYLQQDFTQIRAAAATSIFLLSLKSLYDHKNNYWLYTIIACMFHFSSLLMIPLWFLSVNTIKKKTWIGFIIIAYIMALCKIDIIYILGLLPIEAVQSKYAMYKNIQEHGDYTANIFSILQISKIIIWSILLWKLDIIYSHNKYAILLLKITTISLASLPMLSLNIAASLRIMEYYGIVEIILFPMLLYVIRPNWITKIILIFFSAIILYMRIFVWELIKR